MQLTKDQALLLDHINQSHPVHRRTDSLARYMKLLHGDRWDLCHTPQIGLQLRERGMVTTYKDDQQYCRWDMTPVGVAALAEHRNRGKRPDKAAPVVVPANTRHWVIDRETEQANGPFSCLSAARKEAEQAARDQPGTEYIIVAEQQTIVAELTVKVKP